MSFHTEQEFKLLLQHVMSVSTRVLSQTGDNDVTFMDTAPDSFVMSQWQHDHMFLVWGEVVNMER